MSIRMRNDLIINVPLQRTPIFLIAFIGNPTLGQ